MHSVPAAMPSQGNTRKMYMPKSILEKLNNLTCMILDRVKEENLERAHACMDS